ncbi:ketosynthase chain-length factor [Streptomyces glomeratus]|uniref:Ketosynthase chain-length factor n=1 Tax=Streptomyces glomeratus TaxID=284452 RepID=A0ABP6L1N9_9ACTN|nr:ketosynthase chain-length factor [Streptomyces glomeratus]MCF1509571.1 ketosynthase chain-length factor [Streptomyces glomeratus]
MTRRAVVTGLGVLAPTGIGTKAYWAAALDGRSGLGPMTRMDPSGYPIKVIGEVRDFVPGDLLPSRVVVETALMTQYGLVCADEALRDGELDPGEQPEYEMSVVTANATGGAEFGQREMQNLYAKGPSQVGAYMAIAWFYAANSGQISIRHGMRGPSGVFITDQAGGLDCVGQARRVIRNGSTFALSGGTDSSFSPSGLVGQIPPGLVSLSTDPDRAYLPFDVAADGYTPGEGGAILLVEEAASAQARGVRPYGEIAGYATAFDPHPRTGRGPNLRRAIEGALADARTAPEDVDVVFADGYGVPRLDRLECEALAGVFGPRGVAVTVPKTATGRMYAAGPTVDLVAALLSLRHGVIPSTLNVTAVSPDCPVDLVLGDPREARVRTALVIARGYNGFNAAVVVKAVA